MSKQPPHGSEWRAFLEAKLGTSKWVVAFRMTPRLRNKGYLVAVTPKRFTALEAEFMARP